MSIVLSLDSRETLLKRKRPKRLSFPQKHTKVERDLRAQMNKLWQRVLFPATETIQAMVKRGTTPQEIAEFLEQVLERAEFDYGISADDIIWRWKLSMDDVTRGAMNAGLRKSLGIDIDSVITTQPVKDALAMAGLDAAALIKSIPGDYLGQVARAVSDNFSGRPLPEGRSLLQQIQHIGQDSKARAKLIARDQTSKLTASLNQTRQQAIGISTYIWRTSGDERVVGRPSGLYPTGSRAHGNHYMMEGKLCRWDDARVYSDDSGKTWKPRKSDMAKAHPGQEIQCRCWAEPVVDINAILAAAQ